MVTYDSGAGGHYISEKDRRNAGLPILRPSTRKVGVANGGTSTAKYVTQLPFQQLSAQAMQADTFQDFPTSLMSVGKTANDGTVSVFTKDKRGRQRIQRRRRAHHMQGRTHPHRCKR